MNITNGVAVLEPHAKDDGTDECQNQYNDEGEDDGYLDDSPSSSASSSRAILVKGIPSESFGQGLVPTLREYVRRCWLENTSELLSSDRDTSSPPRLSRVVIERNHHRHIRLCLLMFDTPLSAQQWMEAYLKTTGDDNSPSSCRCVYENVHIVFDFCAGRLRDHFFPSLPYAIRRKMCLDSEATYSVSDEVVADRMASLLKIFACAIRRSNPLVGDAAVPPKYSVLDAMACVGGNTLGFLKHFDVVVAIEIDATRFKMLEENVALVLPLAAPSSGTSFAPSSILLNNADVLCSLFRPSMSSMPRRGAAAISDCDVLFFDPPWGGSGYADIVLRNHGDLPLDSSCVSSVFEAVVRAAGVASSMVVDADLLFPLAPVLAWKLPSCMDMTALAVTVTETPPIRIWEDTSDDGGTVAAPVMMKERCFPFRFDFGAHTTLFVVAVAGDRRATGHWGHTGEEQKGGDAAAATRLPLWFSNASLDELIASIHEWHHVSAAHECRPQFYDFEKKRWIMLKKWIPQSKRERRVRSVCGDTKGE